MLCELYAGVCVARFCVFWPDNVLVEGHIASCAVFAEHATWLAGAFFRRS